MTFKIGFAERESENEAAEAARSPELETAEPRKSVVQVCFAERNMKLAYYNDRFDLKCGDWVYVDGKLEGLRGRVVEVSYNFKIRLADYHRVIAVADTDIHGQFFLAASHFVTFDPSALPVGKATAWFKAPAKPEDEFVSGRDEAVFRLDELGKMPVNGAVAERGHDYYMNNQVRYLCLDGTRGYAIVEGSQAYEVEFEYCGGEIRGLTCTCFCSGSCKHEFAVMLQLREILQTIEKNYAEQYRRTGYFAAIGKGTLFQLAIDGRENGSFVL